MKKYLVQYEKIKYVSYIVKANNEEEAKVIGENLRERNLGYDEDDDCNYAALVRLHRCIIHEDPQKITNEQMNELRRKCMEKLND